jgi:phosphoglycolate phosphatase
MEPLLILWDVDGTLIRAGDIAARVFEEALESVVGEAPRERVRMSGKTDPQIITEYLQMMGISDEDVVASVLARAERDLASAELLLREQGRVCAGAYDLLSTLSANALVTQTLLTGNVVANARVKLRAFGLDQFIDFEIGAYGSDHTERNRLVPIALERASRIRSLDVDPARTWVIGDTPNDAACARAGGVNCLLVATGTYSLEELRLEDADATLEDLSDTGRVLDVIGVDRA